MPMYDTICAVCGKIVLDNWEPITFGDRTPCECGGVRERALLPGTVTHAIGDECDVLIKNALCNADGTPRRYTSKQEIAREAARRGYTQHVEHLGTRSGDRSKHTTRWT